MIVIPIILWLLFEWYVFKGFASAITFVANPLLKKLLLIAYWLIPLFMLGQIIYLFWLTRQPNYSPSTAYWSSFMATTVLFIVPKLLIFGSHLIEDIVYSISWLFHKINPGELASETERSGTISRARFITQLGVILATIPFFSILYGILFGRFNFTVVRKQLSFASLPKAFNGLKIVHISDMHLGSFQQKHEPVKKAINMINELNPDLVLFTGDLVNNHTDEVHGWEDILSGIKANIGKYSITGNHDYGDYFRWSSKEEKQANFERFKAKHKEIGFELLLNNQLSFQKGEEKIVLAGVENWGKPPFKQYGDLAKALMDVSDDTFTILMSHDPSHWDEEVIPKSQVDLTLSGHTHGMQFGIDIPGFKWSPVKYKYPRWSGLYEEGSQKLYVNRGFGYLAFPGRVGMPPEITLIELQST